MAITKIQSGALPADVITTAAIDDASVTHAKLHATMDLSGKTVTLPTLSTLNTTGNVLVGTIDTNVANNSGSGNDGVNIHPDSIRIARTDGDMLLLNRLNSDGDIIKFLKDGGTVGTIGTASNFMTIGSGDVGLRFHATNNVIFPHDMSANNTPNGTIDLGTTGSRFSSLWLAGTGNAPYFTASDNGSAGVDTRIVAANTGNGGTNRGVAIGLHPAGSSNSVEAVKLIGYQNTAASTANNAAFAIQVANTSGTQIERMRITSAGNVGIGTNTPTGKLEIQGTAIGNAGVDVDYFKALKLSLPDSTEWGGQAQFSVGRWEENSANARSSLVISLGHGALNSDTDADVDVMTLLSNGNVGIGNTDPAEKLVLGNTSDTNPRLQFLSSTSGGNTIHFGDGTSADAYRGYIHYSHANDSLAIATAGTEALKIDNYGNIWGVNRGFIVSSGTQTGNFYNSGDGGGLYRQASYANCGTHMEIANNAAHGWSNIYLHKSWTSGQDQRFLQFTVNGAVVGSITSNASSTSYATSSDYRLKENVVDLTGASARVNQLNPSRFNFIADDTNTLVDGFLAHEVATVVPEAINGTKDAMRDEEYEVTPAVEATYDEDGNELTAAVEAVMGTRSVPDYQGIDQSKLVPLLTAALQEALTEIASLKTRVEALE